MSNYTAAVELGLGEVYAHFPKLKRSIAQDKRIIEICNRFVGAGVVPTADLYALAIEESYSEPDSTTNTVIDYATASAAQQAQQSAAALEQANRAVFAQLLERHGLLASSEGNFRMLVDFCGGTLSIEGAEFLIANPPKGLQLLFTDERDSWIEKIILLLHDPTERRFTKWDEQQERKRLAYRSRTELMARYNQLKEKQTLAQRSVTQLKADLAAQRKKEQGEFGWNGTGYPRLLSSMVPKYSVPEMAWDTIRAVPTGTYLRYLGKHDLAQFKRMCALYSVEQVNFWLAQ